MRILSIILPLAYNNGLPYVREQGLDILIDSGAGRSYLAQAVLDQDGPLATRARAVGAENSCEAAGLAFPDDSGLLGLGVDDLYLGDTTSYFLPPRFRAAGFLAAGLADDAGFFAGLAAGLGAGFFFFWGGALAGFAARFFPFAGAAHTRDHGSRPELRLSSPRGVRLRARRRCQPHEHVLPAIQCVAAPAAPLRLPAHKTLSRSLAARTDASLMIVRGRPAMFKKSDALSTVF